LELRRDIWQTKLEPLSYRMALLAWSCDCV